MGYNSTTLKFVLNALLEEAQIVSTADLRRIFAEIFAALRPSTLLGIEDRMDTLHQDDHPRVSPDLMLERNLSELVDHLTVDQRQILLGKFQRISDADLARALNLSRPTIQKYREQAVARVQATVAGLDDHERDAAYELLIRMIDERETADGNR
jgi:DNA-binding CsgD family transcriptional regulator